MTTFQCLGGEQGTGLSGFESAMSGVDQGGVYLPHPRTAQCVDVLIPTAVLHVMQAVLNAPVVAEHLQQFLWPHCWELRLVSRYQRSRLTSPVAIATLSFSTITPCLAPGNPNSSRM